MANDRFRPRDPARGPEAPDAVAPQSRPTPQPGTVAHLLWLQRTAGNRAVARSVEDGDYDPLGQQGREEDEARQISFDERDAEDAAFLRSFETRALELTHGLLDGSEEQMRADCERYGITRGAVDDEGLARTAQGLADAIAVLTTLYGELGAYEHSAEDAVGAEHEGEAFFEGEPHASSGGGGRAPPRAPPAELSVLIEGAERDYATLRAEGTAAYPVLALYAPAHLGAGAPGVAGLAAATPPEQAAMLSVHLSETLENIATVRGALADGDLEIWTLPRIVGLTKRAMGVAGDSREQQVLEDNIASVEADEALQDLAVGAIGVALGLAAAMSLGAGAPLAAAAFSTLGAGLTALEIVDEVQDYLVAEAAAGTDLEKANAIAAGEPDLIWLAIAVLAGLADVYVAAAAFRSLRGLARGAVTAVADRAAVGAADDAALDELEAVGRLRSEANDQLPGLGDELAAGAVREGAKAAGGHAGAAGVRVTARERLLEHLDMLGRRFRTWVRSGQVDRLDADLQTAEGFADEIRAGKWPTAEMAQLPQDELDELAERYLQAVGNKAEQAQVESMEVVPTVAGGSSRRTDLRGGLVLDTE